VPDFVMNLYWILALIISSPYLLVFGDDYVCGT